MIGDASQDMRQIGFWIEPIQFCRTKQAVHRGGSFTARIGSGEEVVFTAECDISHRTFSRVVVDL